jgi:hypothetical protein
MHHSLMGMHHIQPIWVLGLHGLWGVTRVFGLQ